jgi:hypothetical protein
MNDEARLELERYFDGELPADRHAEVARLLSEDHEARVYLDRLAGLRALAQRHDPAAGRPAGLVAISLPSRPRRVRAWAIAVAALAVSIAALVVGRNHSTSEAPDAPNLRVVAGPTQVPPEPNPPIRTHEVALYTWANTAQRRPEPAASALLLPRMYSGKRPAAVEILALELANATTELAGKLEPLALLHKPAPGGRSRNERHGRHIRSVTPGA